MYPVILTNARPTGRAKLLPIRPTCTSDAYPQWPDADVAALLLELALTDHARDNRFVITG